MRKLMWLAIGFGVSCTLGAYLWIGKWMIFIGIAGAVGTLCILRKEKWARRAAWACLGILLGTGWFYVFDRIYTEPLRKLDGKTVCVTMTTIGTSWETDYGSAVDCDLDLDGKRYTIRLYCSENQELGPWTTISCPVEFRLTTNGGQKEATFHPTRGIMALGYQRDKAEITVRDDRETGFLVLLQCDLQNRIRTTIDSCFEAENATFVKALILGDKTELSYETSTDFKVSGISHIVAVSGLHMSVLFALVALLTWNRRWLLAIFGIPSIILFMLVAGFTPSVTRAGIMMILMILSLLFKREYDPSTALSFAVVSLLVFNPLVAAGVGFQLSVGSVAGIFLFMGKIYNWILERIPQYDHRKLKRLRKWFAASVAMTLSAQIVTAPLVAFYFHTVSLVSLLTNLLVVWMVAFVFYGVILMCLATIIWMPAAIFLGKLVSVPISCICQSARFLAKLPLAAVYTDSIYIVIWLCFVYALIFLLIFGKEKRPVLSVALAAFGLAAALLLSALEPKLHDQVVSVVDVGQGQSVILQHRDKTFLVDCGGDYDDDTADTVAQTLLSMGIRRLDGLILTHYDRDHAGGVPGLLYRVKADKLYLPMGEGSEPILDAAGDAQVIWVQQDIRLEANGLKITLFPSQYADSDNESSIAVLFQTEKCDTLLTGDMSALYEQILIREKEIPDLEILIAGHHGSKNANSQALLEATAPDAVVISVGENNRYGHPAEDTLKRLEQLGCAVYRTDESGTIILRR